MKVLSKLTAAPGLTLTSSPIPIIAENEVLIKIKKTAICGTDLHIYNWDSWAQQTIPVPMHVGHEFAGEIIALGEKVNNLQIGDRVSGEGHLICGYCRNCRGHSTHLCRNTQGIGVNKPGAFAEYLALPAFNVIQIPTAIEDDIAAIFDPLGNAVHTALSFNLVGEDVLITGAGPIGIMAAAICRHAGARHVVITDINAYRLELAKKFGVSCTVNMSDCQNEQQSIEKIQVIMQQLSMQEGFDVGLEICGHNNAINTLLKVMNTGGKLGLLGLSGKANITIDWDKMVFRGLTIKGIYGREMFETWYKMISMLQSGLNINHIITHHFKIDDFEQAFSIMNQGLCGKVILDWD